MNDWCLAHSFLHSCDFWSYLSADSTRMRSSLLPFSAADFTNSLECGHSIKTRTCLQAGLLISIPRPQCCSSPTSHGSPPPAFSSSINGTPVHPLHYLGSKY